MRFLIKALSLLSLPIVLTARPAATAPVEPVMPEQSSATPSLSDAVAIPQLMQRALGQVSPEKCETDAASYEKVLIGTTGTLVIPHSRNCTTLKVYFPGHAQELSLKSAVPAHLRPKWANILLEGSHYHLGPTIARAGCPVLLLGESRMAISGADIEKLMREHGLTQLELLSHSGGYVGLNKSLKLWQGSPILERISAVKLLDNFYDTAGLPNTLRESFGVERLRQICTGFYTGHNATRVSGAYRSFCPNLKSADSHKTPVKDYFR